MKLSQRQRNYFVYISLSILFVGSVATMQFLLNSKAYPELLPQLYIAPVLVGFLLGYLIALQKNLRLQIETEQAKFISIVDMAEEFTYLQESNGSYSYVSPSCEKITGFSCHLFYNQPNLFRELLLPEDQQRFDQYSAAIKLEQSIEPINLRLESSKFGQIWLRHAQRQIQNENGDWVACSTNINITDEVKQRQALRELSEIDPLTGLGNRRSLDFHINQFIVNQTPFKLIMMDLDRFKFINDSLGHSYGDRLLKRIASRVQVIIPDKELLTRFGGDEFVLIVPNHIEIEPLIQQVLTEVERAVDLDGYHLKITASFGWVGFPEDAQDMDTLIRFADAAMYAAKEQMGKAVLSYQQMQGQDHARLLQVEYKLQEAIENQLVQGFYQPMVESLTGKVVGVEVLARWHDEELGWIAPDEFIPLAEATNSISQLGLQIMEQSIIFAKQMAVNFNQSIYVSVNVSPQQLIESGFFDKVKGLLDKYQLPARQLKVEVTESLFIGGDYQTIKTLGQLKELGVKIALDDFGTGYAALGVLRDNCIDVLKIDRSFVKHIADSERDLSLVSKIIDLAKSLQLKVVAEGVETAEHCQLLQDLQCDLLQGFYFSGALVEQDFIDWLKDYEAATTPSIK